MHNSGWRWAAGLLLITLGVISILNNFGLTDINIGSLINLLWPLFLITAGINLVRVRRSIPGLVTGAVLLALGVLFFGRNAGFFTFDMTWFWRGFWPLILILIGLNLLFKDRHNGRGQLAIMGALEKTREGWELKSAEYTAIMGGIDLDVRKARFTEKEVFLKLSAIMGGIKVILPEDVAVTLKGTAVLGGVDLLGKGSGGIFGSSSLQAGDLQSAEKIIHFDCTTIMGGIEVKH